MSVRSGSNGRSRIYGTATAKGSWRPRTSRGPSLKKPGYGNGEIKPALGHLKIKDVTQDDAEAVVQAPLRLDDKGGVIGGRAEAGNTYRLLHHMFRKALAWGLRPKEVGNP